MGQAINGRSALMATLTISALKRVSKESSFWKEPAVYRALLVTGLSVLITATEIVDSDLAIH